ncbi:PREDICTED: uncharacterized protein LOC108550250 isoform X2 [Eufriesea mexicana]|uniref:uncharacterized protein LOC108550250 isoform X2 n=1 Tax=Eufriesea mexicana TaxID=516756 RepID=UPI00083C44AC|nr:PREDICTED: uncharacterized protein LOC108550250 isoform X2 [Eufriesea mexicana]
MENRATRSFFGFSIFIFFLYFMKVSTAPSIPAKRSIIDVMKNDTQLCTIPTFLYENNVTESCQNITYPDGNNKKSHQCDLECTSTFLCLAFYDTWYKACQFNQSQNTFNNVTTFYSYIQKSSPGEKEDDQAKFCKNNKDIQFSYTKLKPLLSLVDFNNSNVCYLTCFGVTAKFVPLCAILVWSKSIDDMQQISKNLQTVSANNILDTQLFVTSVKQNTQEQDTNTILNKTSSGIVEESGNDTVEKPNTNKAIDVNDKAPLSQEAVQTNTKYPADKSEQSTVNNINSSPSNQKTKVESTIEKEKLENSNEKPVSNVGAGNKKEANEIVETSTLSENTQDHENTVNLDEWNREDDKLSNDPDDVPDQSIDTDQGQGIPKPSEQRDIISHYHSIRTDEESHFFTYFTAVSLISIAAYIGYHNKQKIFAIVLEGRRTRNSRGRRRPSTVNYRKLDCTLEEAVTSQCNANVTHTHVIY